MANYGIPYMGSKDSIAHKIWSIFPAADNFYDLFGGGFSVTHYMLQHRFNRYKNFYFNELNSGTVELIKDAISGKFNYKVFKPPFVTREEFFQKKDSCAYTRIIWSFGNNQKSYIFGEEIEQYKKSLHNAVVFGELDTTAIKMLGISKWPNGSSLKGRRLFCRKKEVKERVGELQQLRQLQQLQRLQQLEQLEQLLQLERLQRLEQLQRLQQLQRLELTSLSYQEVEIKPNSIIYCDPPYKGTTEYLGSFDHVAFWEWVRKQQNPVFVSEYTAPKGIKTIMAIRKKSRLASKSPTDSVEKVFGNEAAVKSLEYNQR